MGQTITASFGLDINPLKAGFDRAASLSASAAKNIGSRISAFITSPLAAVTAAASGFLTYETFKHGIQGVMETGDELAKLSTKTGIAVGSLATLQGIFKAAEVPADNLGSAIGKMQRNLFSASKVGGPAGNALRILNLNVADLMKLKPEQEFVALGHAINALPTPILRTNTAMALFGKSGMDLLPVFEEMGDVDFGHLSAKAQILEKDARIFDETTKGFRRARANLQGVFYGMADSLAPSLLALSRLLSKQSAVSFGIELGKGIKTATEYLFGVFADPSSFGDLVANAVLYGYATAGNFLLNNLLNVAVSFTEDLLVGVDTVSRALSAGVAVATDHLTSGAAGLKAVLVLAAGAFVEVLLNGMINAGKFLKMDTSVLEAVLLGIGPGVQAAANASLASIKPARSFAQAFAQQPLTGAGQLGIQSMVGRKAPHIDFLGAAGFSAGMQKNAAKVQQAGAAAITPFLTSLGIAGAAASAAAGGTGFAAMNHTLQTGGLTSGHLGSTGLGGGAYGAVHAGDAARRKAEAAKKDKEEDKWQSRFGDLMSVLKEGLTDGA